MKSYQLLVITMLIGILISWKVSNENWLIKKYKAYNLLYTAADKKNVKEYTKLVDNGIVFVNTFFNSACKNKFNIVVHPNRHSLDITWQIDWNMPEFKSECWMVASGVASKLDIISPKIWEIEACEHRYSETKKTQQLITHELVHVFHGQLNVSPDFSNVEGIDWFVEGLATYASGQCDSIRISEIKQAIADQKIPKSLDNFWSGKLKYGLSGSVVMYIDHQYGRDKLIELLPFNEKTELLSTLKTTEAQLLEGWQTYIQNL